LPDTKVSAALGPMTAIDLSDVCPGQPLILVLEQHQRLALLPTQFTMLRESTTLKGI
jgi:hypothetical protein